MITNLRAVGILSLQWAAAPVATQLDIEATTIGTTSATATGVSVDVQLGPITADLGLDGFAPTLGPAQALPGVASLVLTGFVPTVEKGNQTVIIQRANLILTGFIPGAATTGWAITKAPSTSWWQRTAFDDSSGGRDFIYVASDQFAMIAVEDSLRAVPVLDEPVTKDT